DRRTAGPFNFCLLLSEGWSRFLGLIAHSCGRLGLQELWPGSGAVGCFEQVGIGEIEELAHIALLLPERIARGEWLHIERLLNEGQDRSPIALSVRHVVRLGKRRDHHQRYTETGDVESAAD